MAAVTGVITAVAGLGLTAYQMYEQDKAGKEASQAATAAANRLKSIEEKNVSQQIQTPDISSLAFEKIAQSEAAGLEALKGMGAEGAIGGTTSMVEQGRQAALGVAEKQSLLEHQTDFKKAQMEQALESRKTDGEVALLSGELEGAQTAAKDADMGKQAAMMDMVTGIGNVATGIGQATSLDAKAQRQAGKQAKQASQAGLEASQDYSRYLSDYTDMYDSGVFNDGGIGINNNEYSKYLENLNRDLTQLQKGN
jgi:hypothetical protein